MRDDDARRPGSVPTARNDFAVDRDTILGSDSGVTTIEYTLVLAFMASISIFVSISLIGVLRNMVAVLAVKIALFLTGFP